MNSIEALKAFLDGKKIRNLDWEDDCYTQMGLSNHDCNEKKLNTFDIFDSNQQWEEYKAPKLWDLKVGDKFALYQKVHTIVFVNEEYACIERPSGEPWFLFKENFLKEKFFPEGSFVRM